MASSSDDLSLAEARAAAARAQVNATVGELQTRLEPRAVLNEARVLATGGGQRALAASRKAMLLHPGAVAGAVAVMALLASGRLWKARRRRAKQAAVRGVRLPVSADANEEPIS